MTTSRELWLDLLTWTHPFSDTIYSKQDVLSVLKFHSWGISHLSWERWCSPQGVCPSPWITWAHTQSRIPQQWQQVRACGDGEEYAYTARFLVFGQESMVHWGSRLWVYCFVAYLYVGGRKDSDTWTLEVENSWVWICQCYKYYGSSSLTWTVSS